MSRDYLRRASFDPCEPRCCLSTVVFEPHTIDCCTEFGADSAAAADLDGDGDLDVLSTSWQDNTIAWYQNTDGRGLFGKRQVIAARIRGANSIQAADLDGDGDLDVLSTSATDNRIVWHENTDGQGTFAPPQVVATAVAGAGSVQAGDLDQDGDLDVLAVAQYDNTIAWYENSDGQATFDPRRVISSQATAVFAAYAADLDGDRDLDVLSASPRDNKIAWYENRDGRGAFGTQRVITTRAVQAAAVFACDLDGDGDLDALSASFGDNKIAWYENTDGRGSFSGQRVITTQALGAADVYTADLDRDGDPDVLSASYSDNKIAWYENTDGRGTFGPQQIITTRDGGARSVVAVDLDADGDLDVLAAAFSLGKIAWYENRVIGDSNDDGLFNSADFVHVFQAGEYEDDVAGNSTFDEGDWNQDGDFNSDDLVFAFQVGHYEAAAARLAGAIAAAVDWLFTQENVHKLLPEREP